MTNDLHYRNRLDSLLEGIQIIDSQWRYVYLNNVMTEQARMSKEELLGQKMTDKYPGIEHTELFRLLKATMADRQPRQIENQFTFPDQTVRWFDLRIEPSPEGICILSLDITAHKEYEQKITKAKNLYAFLSHINQSIVHVRDEKELFRTACAIAIRHGGFKMAWIGLFDPDGKSVRLAEQCGVDGELAASLAQTAFFEAGPLRQMLETKSHYVCNDTQQLDDEPMREYATAHGISSFVILPLRKLGNMAGAFHFYADQPYFIGTDEIALLEEITSDISFALTNYENEKRHRETELALIQNEKRFRALIEKSTDMKTLADRQGRLFWGSPSVIKMLGYDSDQQNGAFVFDFIHPDDLPEFVRKRNRLIEHPGTTVEFEMRMRRSDGQWIWTEGTITNLLEESGVGGLVANFRDITERKRDEERLEFERHNTDALINNTHDMMWSVDTQLQLITANRAFHEQIAKGLGRKMHVGEYVFNYPLPEEKQKRYESHYQRALAGESFSELVASAAPQPSWAEIAFRPIIHDNAIVGVACHSHEITDRILSEQRLERQNRDLTKANFELDRFVYSVSHDLRSPLTSILGLLSIMEDDTREASTRLHLEMIRGRINHLDVFIRNILNYSRNNRADLEIERVALREIVGLAISGLHDLKSAASIRFEVKIPENLALWTDRQSILTVLTNLLTNAIKFHNLEKPEPVIRLTAFEDGEMIQLTVTDNGIGIAPNQVDRVFGMFYRASAKTEGTGLGLYIVREIVEKLGGSIAVSSQEHEGTTFYVSLKNHHQ